jgi:hypothetical protein
LPATALGWCIGVSGMMTAFSYIVFLRRATLPDVATAAENAQGGGDGVDLITLWRAVELETIHRFEQVIFPLSAAQLVLYGLLVVGCGLAMGSRRSGRELAIQAFAANAVLVAVAYALSRGVRGACIDAVVRAAETLPVTTPQRATYGSREALWWVTRFKLAFEVAAMGLGLYALTRPRTKAYYDEVARAAESAEEP